MQGSYYGREKFVIVSRKSGWKIPGAAVINDIDDIIREGNYTEYDDSVFSE